MKTLFDLSPEEIKEWEQWVEGRPPKIKETALRLPPWFLYTLKETGQRVTIFSYEELLSKDHERTGVVQVKVDVLEPYNCVGPVGRRVFGIDPESLEPCSDHRPWWERNPEDDVLREGVQGE